MVVTGNPLPDGVDGSPKPDQQPHLGKEPPPADVIGDDMNREAENKERERKTGDRKKQEENANCAGVVQQSFWEEHY